MCQGQSVPRSGPLRQLPFMRGFTLVELLITVVVVAIGVALAVPSWDNLVQKRNLTNTAEEITAMISWAQGSAIKRNEQVTVTIRRGNDAVWCVGAVDQTRRDLMGITRCDCFALPTANDGCQVESMPSRINSGIGQESNLTSSSVGGTEAGISSFSFDPVRGLKIFNAGAVDSRDHTVQLQSKNGKYELQVDVSVTGRTRICNSDSAKKVPGFDTCVSAAIEVPAP